MEEELQEEAMEEARELTLVTPTFAAAGPGTAAGNAAAGGSGRHVD